MKPISTAVVALALFSLQPAASAQVPPAYMTVDAVQFNGSQLTVTGLVQGDAAPSTHTISYSFGEPARTSALEYCQKLLLLALAKPGQYVVQAGPNLCKLALATP